MLQPAYSDPKLSSEPASTGQLNMDTGQPPITDDQADITLLRQIQQGDFTSMESFYHQYRSKLGRFLFRLLRNTALVDEVYNDIMMIIWNKASQFKGDSKVSTWVFSIAYRQGIKHLNKESKHNSISIDELNEKGSSDQIEMQMDDSSSPISPDLKMKASHSSEQQLENQQLLLKGLSLLSRDHRTVVELAYFNGYNYGEIAAIMECPEATVKTRMHYAKKKLKEALDQLNDLPNPSSQSTELGGNHG